MKQTLTILAIAIALTTNAQTRTWTSTKGQKIQAEVVKVNPDKTAVLKTEQGKTVKVRFNSFIKADEEHLETLLSRGRLHPVPWREMNDLFGIPIWQDENLWNDPTDAVADRLLLRLESKTDFVENHRSYPLGRHLTLQKATYAKTLYGGQEFVSSLSFVFLNVGDEPAICNATPLSIEVCGETIRDRLAVKLGKPKRDSLGRGNMREKVWRWDWNGHAVMLAVQEERYVALRIMPVDRADRAGRFEKIKEAEMKKRMAACVKRRENGDVIIKNIPMVDQGPKGYCSPATWERYLRYMDIPADMYLLALVGNTDEDGTDCYEMIDAVKSLVSANGRELEDIGWSLSIEEVAEYVDQGLPIMWRFVSTPAFQLKAIENTHRRNGWDVEYELDSGQDEDEETGGHMCLITGYNAATEEIAISDSWGPKFAERWVPIAEAQNLDYGFMNVIKW